ncbi:MAG: DUF4453 domain-containing protein [Pseudomonadota bacterium]
MRFSLAFLTLALGFLPVPFTFAEDARSCDGMWFSRNLIFHRAGYCFGSRLGQSVFGNQGCQRGAPVLSETNQQIVAALKRAEQSWGCSVNTKLQSLDLKSRHLLEKLGRQPVPSDGESGCLGYLGKPLKLFQSPDYKSLEVGLIPRGSDVVDAYERVGRWTVYSALTSDGSSILGWTTEDVWANGCESYAR